MCVTPDRELQDAIALWLNWYHLTRKQYLRHVVNKNMGADGLFVWLSTHAAQSHLNLVHVSGIWTSWKSVLTDPTIVLVLGCFLVSPQMTREELKEDPDYVLLLCDPWSVEFMSMPKVLNEPVYNLQERLDEIGLLALTEELPIQEHMASFLQCSVVDYHDQMC